MKVFFHAYLKSPEEFFEFYKKIYHLIQELGYEQLSDISPKTNSSKLEKTLDTSGYEKRVSLYAKYQKYIKLCDIMVCEISMHSLSSGFLIHEALDHAKPVIALYHEGHNPYFVQNVANDKFQIIEYNLSNLSIRLKLALDQAKKQIDIRFNFFIPPELIIYLNWLSDNKRISKSTFIRDLIFRDMEKNREYKKYKGK